jgi:hypothetical protein
LDTEQDTTALSRDDNKTRYSEFEATIDVGASAVLQRPRPSRALNLVQEWAMIREAELMEHRRLCRDNAQPKKVEPLP